MSMVSEFKDFAMRGNVMDMAVGIILGGAFGKIVSSFVADVLMPPIGLAMGGVDFTSLKAVLKEGAEGVDPVSINYGVFVQHTIDFLIVAFAIFMVIRTMNSLKKKEEEAPAAPAEPSEDVVLLREIRDSLRR